MKKLLCFLLILCLCPMLFGGCSDDNATADKSISMQVPDKARTLDPQLAESLTELTAVVNCFDGLFRLDADGQPAPAAAESYTVSKDGKTYTFRLRDNLMWSDEETPVTASDFVFGLQRALRPETKAPSAALLYSISGAEAVHSGAAPVTKLGVRAADAQTLIITLQNSDPSFLYTLSHPVAMPCNEAFFKSTGGRYGLARDMLLSNGPFYLNRWDTDAGSLRLSRMDGYQGSTRAKPVSVLLDYREESDLIASNLENHYIDVGVVQTEAVSALDSAGLAVYRFQSTAYALSLHPAFSDDDTLLCKALLSALDPDALFSDFPSYYERTDSLVPLSAVDRGQRYASIAGTKPAVSYQAANAQRTYTAYLADIGKDTLPAFTLYYPESPSFKLLANRIAQTWQSTLKLHVNTMAYSAVADASTLPAAEERKAVLVPLTAADNTAYSSLLQFSSAAPDSAVLPPANRDTFDKRLAQAFAASDNDSYFRALKAAEQSLLDTLQIFPLFCSPTCIAAASDISGLIFSGNGSYLDFTGAGKLSG